MNLASRRHPAGRNPFLITHGRPVETCQLDALRIGLALNPAFTGCEID
jgi:hypothetical protein